tara:strand:- start:802 stop:1002 length:201 start_codon:yes stop_codon:yes gene_type:complete
MKNEVIELAKNKTLDVITESKEKIAGYLEQAAAGSDDLDSIVDSIIVELDVLAKADERLEMLEKYF